jgi:hypothetical protein
VSFSINWSEREDYLAALFTALSSDLLTDESPTRLDVRWGKNAEGAAFVDPLTAAVCELATVSLVPYGTPQRTTNVDVPTGQTRVSIESHFVWTVRATFWSLDSTDPMQALSWSERIRSGLYRDDAVDTLALIECGVQRILQTTQLGNQRIDNRRADVASFDLVLNTTSLFVEPQTKQPIEHVEIGARFNDPDATPIDFVEIDFVLTP